MPVESVLEGASVDLPYLDLGVQRSSDHVVVFGMKVHLRHWFSVGIIVLNQTFTPQVVEFDFFVS